MPEIISPNPELTNEAYNAFDKTLSDTSIDRDDIPEALSKEMHERVVKKFPELSYVGIGSEHVVIAKGDSEGNPDRVEAHNYRFLPEYPLQAATLYRANKFARSLFPDNFPKMYGSSTTDNEVRTSKEFIDGKSPKDMKEFKNISRLVYKYKIPIALSDMDDEHTDNLLTSKEGNTYFIDRNNFHASYYLGREKAPDIEGLFNDPEYVDLVGKPAGALENMQRDAQEHLERLYELAIASNIVTDLIKNNYTDTMNSLARRYIKYIDKFNLGEDEETVRSLIGKTVESLYSNTQNMENSGYLNDIDHANANLNEFTLAVEQELET